MITHTNYITVSGGSTVIPASVVSSSSVMGLAPYARAVAFLTDNLASFPRSVHQNGAEPDNPHPLRQVLRRRPNGYQNAFAFWRRLFTHAVHFGNGYARIERDAAYRPVALHNLIPSDVVPFRIVDDAGNIEQYYAHRPTQRVHAAADIIHLVTSATTADGQAGVDPVEQHATTFQRGLSMTKYQTKFLQQGTVIRGSIELPGEASDETLAQLRDTVNRFYRGDDASRDLLFLPGGAKLNNAGLAPEESQLVEQGAQLTKEIAQITGVPPEMLYELSEAKYNASIEAQGQLVVRYTFRPWIIQTEAELTAKLLSAIDQDAGFHVRMNADALVRGDTAAVAKVAIETANAGIRTQNEARALLDLPASDDPEANKLKTRGDTTPRTPAEPAAA